MTKPTYVDIWLHQHKHGTDVYPMFRPIKAGMASVEQVIAAYRIDFEPEEGESLEPAFTAVRIPEDLRFSENAAGLCCWCGRPKERHRGWAKWCLFRFGSREAPSESSR